MKQIRKKSCSPWWKWILTALVLLVVIVGVPLLINQAYKSGTIIYITKWEASDVLAYYGAVLASAGAAIGVYISIRAANKNYQDDVRTRTLPFIAVTPFERKTAINTMALLKKKTEKTQYPNVSSDIPLVQYEEYKLNQIYFIITAHGIDVKNKLNKEQKDILENAGRVMRLSPAGVETLRHIEFHSIPMEIENVGNGTAVNFRVGLNLADDKTDHRFVRPMMLKQGQTLYIHIFSAEKYETVRGNYLLEFHYEDIYRNKYVQQFPVTFDKDEDGREFQSIDLVGRQTRCLGDDTNANP